MDKICLLSSKFKLYYTSRLATCLVIVRDQVAVVTEEDMVVESGMNFEIFGFFLLLIPFVYIPIFEFLSYNCGKTGHMARNCNNNNNNSNSKKCYSCGGKIYFNFNFKYFTYFSLNTLTGFMNFLEHGHLQR
jgi:hypothetical protein